MTSPPAIPTATDFIISFSVIYSFSNEKCHSQHERCYIINVVIRRNKYLHTTQHAA